MSRELLLWVAPVAGVLALLYALFRALWVTKQDAGTDRMKEIAGYIREGAMAFLKKEYSVLIIFVLAVAVLMGVAYYNQPDSHFLIAVSFITGATMSALAGFFGMNVATLANVRTSSAARKSLNSALKIAFAGGSVMGMCVVGLGCLGIGVLFYIYLNFFGSEGANLARTLTVLSGFSLGASSIALFARVGGGIYTKAADVGADLVGKIEAGIPEDDPRNPAVIADNVGDNVGDVAGMGADLYESYVGAIISAMIIGATAVPSIAGNQLNPVLLPLVLAGVGIVSSIIGAFFVRTKEEGNPQKALNFGTFGAAILMFIASYFVIKELLPGEYTAGSITYNATKVFFAMITGLIAGVLIGVLAEYYTTSDRKPTRTVASESQTGHATNIIAGLAVGMQSTALPLIVLAIAIIIAYQMAGLYGIAIAGFGMLSTTGIQLAVDAYGPIADNSGGIAEMSGLPPEVRGRTDKLDAVGNTTAAIGKGFAIGSAALTALALFSAYQSQANIKMIDVSNPMIMGGLLVGAMLPFLFSSMSMKAVGKAAGEMVVEVRRQFKEIPGLMEGKAKADFKRCVSISTAAAIKRMIVPGLMAVIIPVVVGFIDKHILAGLLVGVLASGVVLAIFMANAGASWDNAKKYIEAGNFGGKGSPTHKAAVTGDTVGDPFKDTSGPALNILIKLMSVVALVIAPLIK